MTRDECFRDEGYVDAVGEPDDVIGHPDGDLPQGRFGGICGPIRDEPEDGTSEPPVKEPEI